MIGILLHSLSPMIRCLLTDLIEQTIEYTSIITQGKHVYLVGFLGYTMDVYKDLISIFMCNL
jgi:hypothetical protein